MDLIRNFELQWLEQSASQATPESLYVTMLPAIIMVAIVIWAFLFSHLRSQLKYLPHLNLIALIAVIGSFQACGQKSTSAPQSLTGVSPSVPSGADDLSKYANGTNDQPGYQNIRIFNPRQASQGRNTRVRNYLEQIANANPTAGIIWGYKSSNIQKSVAAECLNYNALLGKTVTYDPGSDTRRPGACEYIRTWEDFPGDDTYPPSIGVKRVLNECRGSAGKLVLDLNIGLSNIETEVPKLRVKNATPFPVYAFCIRENNGGNPTVQLLNPETLSYEFVNDPNNTYSTVTNFQGYAGWYVGAFNGYESNGRISSLSTTIRLFQNQGTNQQQGAAQPLVAPLPAVKVIVVPEGANAAMAEYKMMTTLTDAVQEPIRGSPRVGIVNPANGEVAFDHTDVVYRVPETALGLTFTRSYRSFNNEIGDFGYNWSWLPSKEFYSFATPMGDMGDYSFYRTDDGRLVSRETGPFWNDDEENPLRPDPEKNFFMWGLENSLFDLAGRLISLYDGSTGNRLYYLRHGSSVALIADQMAARSNLRTIVTAMQAGTVSYNPNNPLPSNIDREAIRNALLRVPGNFLYIVRNNKNYIQAVIDKSGNFTWYYYGPAEGGVSGSGASGDHLVRVVRFVSQDAIVTGTQQDSMILYDYAYTGETAFGKTFSGLIQRFTTWDRDEAFAEEITYARNPRRFGAQPQVASATVEGLDYGFTYDYQYSDDAEDPRYTTTVTDWRGSQSATHYVMNPTGQVTRIEGPTESSNREILYESKWDPKLLRVSNEINRGVETVYNWDQETGFMRASKLCADRNESGNRLTALISDEDCTDPNLSRVTNYAPWMQVAWIDEWFKDLSADLVNLDIQLPQTDLYSSGRRYMTENVGCFGGKGVVDFNGQRSGSTCAISSDINGGARLTFQKTDQFEDGSMRSDLTIQAAARFSGTGNPSYWVPSNMGTFNNVNQTGYEVSSPASGATTVYNPETDGQQSLSGNANSYRGIYGEVLATRHPWGAETRTYYDYRTPSPISAGTKVINLRPVNGNDFESASGLVTRLAADGRVMELGERPRSQDLANEIGRAFGMSVSNNGSATFVPTSEAFTRFYNSLIFDQKARSEIQFLEDGSKITTAYTPWGASDSVRSDIRKNSTSDILSLTTDLQYEATTRRLFKIVHPNGTSSETTFRANYDKGAKSTIDDKTAIGGLKVEEETKSYDWAGRPLEIQLKKLSGQTVAPMVTDVTLTYSPFGELQSRTTESGGTTTVLRHTLDLGSGAIIYTTSSTTGTNVDTTEFTSSYNNFDKNLNPRQTVQTPKQLVTEINGVAGKNITTTVMGPQNYENGYPWSRVYSQVTETYDGCGNIIRRENATGSFSVGEQWIVNYGAGLCKVADYFPKVIFGQPPSSQRFSTRYGYMSDGSPTLTNEVYQGILGLEGSMTFVNQFVSDCNRDSHGRCTQAGRIYSFESSGRPVGSDFLIEFAEAAVRSSNGLALQSKKYVSDRITTETASITSPTEFTTGVESLGTSTFTQRINSETSTQNRTGAGSYSSTKTIDAGFGIETGTSQIRSNPVTQANESSNLSQTLDQHGRVISTNFVGGGMTRASNITQWHLGMPKETITTTSFARSGNETHTVRHETFTHDKPTRTTYLRTSGGLSFPGTQDFVRDGLGRPTRTVYTQETPSSVNGYQLVHTRDIVIDTAGRLTQETSELQETRTGSTASYDMGGGYFLNRTPSLNMTGGIQPLTLQNEYTETGVKMTYAGFQVEYFLAQGPGQDGRILKIIATDPSGQSHTYKINSSVTSSAPMGTDPFIGLQDARAGRMTYVDDDRPWWDFIGITNPPPVVKVNNFEYPQMIIPWSNPFDPRYPNCATCPDPIDRTYRVNLTNNTPVGFSPGEFRHTLLTDNVAFPRTSDSPSAVVCDRGGAQSRVGALLTVFDDQRRVAYAERQITKRDDISDIPGLYKLQVFNNYDSFGLPALREQVISFRSTAAGNSFSGANFLPLQVTQNIRMNAAAPEGIQFPQRALTLVEYEDQEVGRRGRTGSLIRGNIRHSPTVYVWGPMGPIFSFYQRDGAWKRRDFIYDQMGNVRSTRCNYEHSLECQTGTKQNEAYLPYLTSVVTEHEGPMSLASHSTGLYYVSGTYQEDGWGDPVPQNTKHNFSWEPHIQPLVSQFGAMGADRDILGIHYSNGVAYDPMGGKYLSPENFNDPKVCNEDVAGMASAQAIVDAALARNSSTEATMTRATSEAAKALFVQDAYFKNAPWWFYASPGFLALGLYYAHDMTGTGWYFKEQAAKLGPIGWQMYGAIKAVDFLCTGDFMRATPGTVMDYWGQAQIGMCVADVVTLGATALPRQAAIQGGKAAAKGAARVAARAVIEEGSESAGRVSLEAAYFAANKGWKESVVQGEKVMRRGQRAIMATDDIADGGAYLNALNLTDDAAKEMSQGLIQFNFKSARNLQDATGAINHEFVHYALRKNPESVATIKHAIKVGDEAALSAEEGVILAEELFANAIWSGAKGAGKNPLGQVARATVKDVYAVLDSGIAKTASRSDLEKVVRNVLKGRGANAGSLGDSFAQAINGYGGFTRLGTRAANVRAAELIASDLQRAAMGGRGSYLLKFRRFFPQ